MPDGHARAARRELFRQVSELTYGQPVNKGERIKWNDIDRLRRQAKKFRIENEIIGDKENE